MANKWMGSTKCDFCGCEIDKELVDGMTNMGPWAVMCPKCFRIHGVGIGPGRGQKYVKSGSDFVKVEPKARKSSARSAMVRAAMSLGLSKDEAEMEVSDFMGI